MKNPPGAQDARGLTQGDAPDQLNQVSISIVAGQLTPL